MKLNRRPKGPRKHPLISIDYYDKDIDGHRVCASPMVHYPDFCPYQIIVCEDEKKCRGLKLQERPCYIARCKK